MDEGKKAGAGLGGFGVGSVGLENTCVLSQVFKKSLFSFVFSYYIFSQPIHRLFRIFWHEKKIKLLLG